MNKRPLLTIAIPSFNRAAHLDSQIRWAVDSIAGRWDLCQLLVADGASTDSTPAVCEKWRKMLGGRITILRQPANLGLVAGICFSIEQADGEYVWTVSDDDTMRADAVTTVIDALQEDRSLGLLHLNHRCVNGIDGTIIHESFYHWVEDQYQSPGKTLIETCLAHSEGALLFMTANVVRRDSALEAIASWPEGVNNLGLPLYIYAYVASNSPMRIISRVSCDCIYGVSSWINRGIIVFYKDVPEVYQRLKQVGYSRPAMNRLILRRLGFNIVTTKVIAKFILKFPLQFLKSTSYYLTALRD